MNISFATPPLERRVRIKVIGVGGAGGNAVNRMIENGLPDVEFYAVNTDSQALEASRAHQAMVIGSHLTRGRGAGGDPEIGRQAAEEDSELLAALVEDADMIFVTAGMGGGTGTGAAPMVAAAARASGALTVAVVTRPFEFEGFRRMEQAEAGLAALRRQVDALLVIPNERLMEIEVPDSGMTTVFQIADNVLYEATRGISDIIARHAVVNLDFADVRTVMRGSGAAIMGTGRAAGAERARTAAQQAVCSPLLENVDILGSRAVLVYLTAACVSRDDLRDAMSYVQQAAGSDAHIFFGFAQDESLDDDLRVTVIATGFPAGGVQAAFQDARPTAEVAKAEDDNGGAGQIDTPAIPALESVVECKPDDVSETASSPIDTQARSDNPVRNDSQPRIVLAAEPGHSMQLDAAVQVQEPTLFDGPGKGESLAEPCRPLVDRQAGVSSNTQESNLVEQTERNACSVERKAQMAAAAGCSLDPASALAPATAGKGQSSFESGRFLEPLGSMTLQDLPGESAKPGHKFRKTEKAEDMLRPAWERKYVD